MRQRMHYKYWEIPFSHKEEKTSELKDRNLEVI